MIVADSANVDLDVDSGWVVETFASCDPAEFDPSVDDQLPFDVWLDADGARVPVSIVRSSSGPEHCGWQSATLLSVDGRGYVADPDGVIDGAEYVEPFDDDAELPADAIDTGYQREGRHIWTSIDKTVVYILEDERVEIWPSSANPVVCG